MSSYDIVTSHPRVRQTLRAQRKKQLRQRAAVVAAAAFVVGSIGFYGWQERQTALHAYLTGCTAQVTNNLGDGYVDYHLRCPDGVAVGLPESLPERRDPGFAVDRGL